ncbi:MAG: molybdate ABC transporter substrate-binding protein [Pleurocapsa sp. SU_196_0]|nr:molybdate ABC transporter substrate-binding protein [Pleurocapsa sp. SU_196_0]
MRERFNRSRFAALLIAGLLIFSASASSQTSTVTVFAASSLTDAFAELGKAFTAKSGTTVTFQFAGSQTLRTQLENGAKADVLASASVAQYDPLVKSGLLETGAIFARNRLVVIAPKRGLGRVKTLADIGKPGVKVVVAQPSVPVGAYTREFLESISRAGVYGADFGSRVLKNVVSEEQNVRQVALKVQLGEADAGVVYTTDVTPSLTAQVIQLAIPTRFNVVAAYPIGALKTAASPSAARAFVAFTLTGEARGILKRWGFLPPAANP